MCSPPCNALDWACRNVSRSGIQVLLKCLLPWLNTVLFVLLRNHRPYTERRRDTATSPHAPTNWLGHPNIEIPKTLGSQGTSPDRAGFRLPKWRPPVRSPLQNFIDMLQSAGRHHSFDVVGEDPVENLLVAEILRRPLLYMGNYRNQ